jgi:hypothetical protein
MSFLFLMVHLKEFGPYNQSFYSLMCVQLIKGVQDYNKNLGRLIFTQMLSTSHHKNITTCMNIC